jgi:WD40 repeat protein
MPPSALQSILGKRPAFTKWAVALILLPTVGITSEPEAPAAQKLPAGSPPAPPAQSLKPRVDLLGDPVPEEVVARMGSGRLRHPGGYRTLAFSSDGKWLVSSASGGVRFWDAATGQLRRRFDVDTDWCLSFAFTAGGIAVASAERDRGIVTVRVIDPVSGKVHRLVEMNERTSVNLTFSPGGKRIAFSHSQRNTLWVCDPVTGQATLGIPGHERMARDIAFSPDGKTIAAADFSDTISVYDALSGKVVRRLRRDKDAVDKVCFSPDGRYLASILAWDREPEGEVRIWDLTTGEERRRLKSASGHVLCAAFSPDGKCLAVGSQHGDLVLWDLSSGNEVRRYPTDAYFGAIAFSPDGRELAAVSGEGAIRLWDTATGRVLPASADPFVNVVHRLRFSRDGRRLSGSAAAYIAWDPATGRELRRFPRVAERGWFSSLSPDESLLASGDRDGTIRLWNAATGEAVRTLKGHEEWAYSLAFSADGRRLYSSSLDATVRVWDVASGRELQKLSGEGELTVSPDACWLASPSGSSIMLGDLGTGRPRASLAMASRNTASRLAFSPDSRWLAAVNGGPFRNDPGEVKVWDVASGKERYSLEGHKTRVASVAFSPDGRMLATGDMSGSLLLWELATGHRRHQFIGHESWIRSLAFSPDGRLLAASSNEAPVYTWDVLGTTKQPQRALSPEELQRCWTALAADDAAAAFQAIRRLAGAPEQTLAFLREILKPVPAPDPKRVRQLVEALDSNDFQQRQKAAAELEKSADAAASLLRQILAKEKLSLGVRRTLQEILEGLETAPESLRAVRAVEMLEWIATPEADRLLRELAKGAADARLTREAAAAHARLRR